MLDYHSQYNLPFVGTKVVKTAVYVAKIFFFKLSFLKETSEQHKGKFLVVVTFRLFFRRISCLAETSSGNDYNLNVEQHIQHVNVS